MRTVTMSNATQNGHPAQRVSRPTPNGVMHVHVGFPHTLNDAQGDGRFIMGAIDAAVTQGTTTAIERCDSRFGGTA